MIALPLVLSLAAGRDKPCPYNFTAARIVGFIKLRRRHETDGGVEL
jgi:hypothetical protein